MGFGDGELAGPHTADENPLNPDEIVVSEQYGCDILVISRSTGELRGKIYLMEAGIPRLLQRYQRDFPQHVTLTRD